MSTADLEELKVPPKGYKFSSEARQKMSEAAKGNTNRRGAVLSPETRAKISASKSGVSVPCSDQNRASLDRDKLNNEPLNLVVSCVSCNSKRWQEG